MSSTGSQLEQTRRVVNADGLKAGTDVFIGRGSLPELEGRDCGELPRRAPRLHFGNVNDSLLSAAFNALLAESNRQSAHLHVIFSRCLQIKARRG